MQQAVITSRARFHARRGLSGESLQSPLRRMQSPTMPALDFGVDIAVDIAIDIAVGIAIDIAA
jgi:hypothetical protein